jgi:hypothetical protein
LRGEIAILIVNRRSRRIVNEKQPEPEATMKRFGFFLTLISTSYLFTSVCVAQVTNVPLVGGTYTGDWKNGQPNGHGTLIVPNGNKYIGEWKEGQWNGQGTLILPNGVMYEGEFKDGVKDGQGTFKRSNGSTYYIGEFKNNNFNGHGTLNPGYVARLVFPPDVHPEKYEGEFEDGEQDGQGTETYSDGRTYVGEFKEGEHDGHGTITFPDGRQFVGQFHKGKMAGKGKMTYPDGTVEEGLWKNGKCLEAAP